MNKEKMMDPRAYKTYLWLVFAIFLTSFQVTFLGAATWKRGACTFFPSRLAMSEPLPGLAKLDPCKSLKYSCISGQESFQTLGRKEGGVLKQAMQVSQRFFLPFISGILVGILGLGVGYYAFTSSFLLSPRSCAAKKTCKRKAATVLKKEALFFDSQQADPSRLS